MINLRLTVDAVGLAAFWVASGISFAMFARCPQRMWPGLALGVFAACALGNWQAGYPLDVGLAMAVANTVEPAIGASIYHLARRLLKRHDDVAVIPLMIAATSASACGAAIGGGAWWLFAGASLPTTALHWLFSDLVGIVSIAPFLLVLGRPASPRVEGEARPLETLAIFVGLASAVVASFVLFPARLEVQGAVFVVQSFLLWGGLRLRRREATALAVLHSTSILFVTAFGMGPFVFSAHSVEGRFIRLQLFLSISTAFYLALFETVQRVRASERLIKTSRDELRQVLDCSPDAVFVHEASSGKILDVNERTLQMYRCRREDVIGAHPGFFSSGGAKFDFAAAEQRMTAAPHGQLAPFEWRARRQDGTEFWSEVALRLARIGDVPRVIATVRDIDRRKQMEDRLRHAQKLEIIGRLTGGIVHDFRNIIMAMNGLVALLKEDVKDQSAAHETLHMLESTMAGAADLTEKLLSFSRKSERAFSNVSLHGCLLETITLLERTLPKTVAISSNLAAQRQQIEGDATSLPNAFLNLALNARDAMPNGGSLEISTKNRELDAEFCNRSITPIEPGEFVEVTFADEGRGISPEHLAHLFQPFFTTKENGRGTGLGLSSVLSCMQEHCGTVEVETGVGRGTAVHLLFPLPDATPSSRRTA